MRKKLGARMYIECSALKNEGVGTVFEEAARYALRAPVKGKRRKW
jgi:hypothetical protein